MKKTTETEYSNTKSRMLPKLSPKKVLTERVFFRIYKSEANKTSMPYVEKNQMQTKKTLKN